jgi:hypothetical protein
MVRDIILITSFIKYYKSAVSQLSKLIFVEWKHALAMMFWYTELNLAQDLIHHLSDGSSAPPP